MHPFTHSRPWHGDPAIVKDVPGLQAASWPAQSLRGIDTFDIHLAATKAGRQSASALVNRLYGARGYGRSHQVVADAHHLTLTASSLGRLLGTVTLGRDAPDGLLADEVFKEEIDAYRRTGARVAEVTKLVVDPGAHSQMALASLFHIVYLYAHKVFQCTDVFIEVNPRHRRFYQSMLGFEDEADVRTNPRVDAPAHLLRINLDYMEVQIERLGGTGESVGRDRSLYPYFFSVTESRRIMQRLMVLNNPPDALPVMKNSVYKNRSVMYNNLHENTYHQSSRFKHWSIHPRS